MDRNCNSVEITGSKYASLLRYPMIPSDDVQSVAAPGSNADFFGLRVRSV